MKILVNFTEAISDNHQGGSGKIFDRQSIFECNTADTVGELINKIMDRMQSEYRPFYDLNDRHQLRINSIEIFP